MEKIRNNWNPERKKEIEGEIDHREDRIHQSEKIKNN